MGEITEEGNKDDEEKKQDEGSKDGTEKKDGSEEAKEVNEKFVNFSFLKYARAYLRAWPNP